MLAQPTRTPVRTARLAGWFASLDTRCMSQTSDALGAVESAAESQPMGWLARFGLTARGCVYLIMGVLAVLLGLGEHSNVDQKSALTVLITKPYGGVLVALMALGFAAYAVWRLSEAAFGVTGEPGAGPRVKSLGRGLAYAVLAYTAVSLLLGSRTSQSGQQSHLAGGVMSHPGGRWLVGIVGVAVAVVGLIMIREGWSKKFMRYFGSLPAQLRGTVVRLGQVGTVARGAVFAITGVLVVAAAWTADPSKAGGLTESFQALLGLSYGPALVVALGAGLVIFGLYGLAEARWRRVPAQRA